MLNKNIIDLIYTLGTGLLLTGNVLASEAQLTTVANNNRANPRMELFRDHGITAQAKPQAPSSINLNKLDLYRNQNAQLTTGPKLSVATRFFNNSATLSQPVEQQPHSNVLAFRRPAVN